MSTADQYYPPDIAAKAVVELTNAIRGAADDEYAIALLADPRMVSNRGHLASCGVNMREAKQIKALLGGGLPTLDAQRRALSFLDQLDGLSGGGFAHVG